MEGKGYLKEHSSLVQISARVLDLSVVIGAFYLAYFIQWGHFRLYLGYQVALVVSCVVVASIFPIFNVYRSWRADSVRQELTAIFFGWFTSCFVIISLAFILKSSDVYSRIWFAYWFSLVVVGLSVIRLAVRLLLYFVRKKGFNQRSIVIVGSGKLLTKTIEHINHAPWAGLNVDGVFGNNEPKDEKLKNLYKGDINHFEQTLKTTKVDQVWFAVPFEKAEKIKKYYEIATIYGTEIKYVPDLFGMELLNHSISELNGLPVLNIVKSPMEGINALIKRVEDIILSTLILLFISPVMLVVALGVKLNSKGPVFYKQERVSWNGRKFGMLKFRSMAVNSESSNIEWGGAKNKQVTRFGKFIRRTSLDELPQFINVLKGDMAIVGPRPERSVFVEQFKKEIPRYMHKHIVKAGITGWAQINGWRGDTDLTERVDCDLFYIENWSIYFDIKIIILTLFKGFNNKNAC